MTDRPPTDPDHPYSLVRMAPGGTIYTSGVLPYDEDGSVATDFPRAATRVLEVLAARLAAEGVGLADVIKTTVYVTDIALRPAVNHAWSTTFPHPLPVRTLVEVAALPGGSRIEVEAVAIRA